MHLPVTVALDEREIFEAIGKAVIKKLELDTSKTSYHWDVTLDINETTNFEFRAVVKISEVK